MQTAHHWATCGDRSAVKKQSSAISGSSDVAGWQVKSVSITARRGDTDSWVTQEAEKGDYSSDLQVPSSLFTVIVNNAIMNGKKFTVPKLHKK